jgi:hypothetical protein
MHGTDEKCIELGRLGHRWEDNIRMVFREVVWEGVEWMFLA